MLFKNKIEYTKGMFVEIYGTEIKKVRLVLRIITGIAVVAAIAFMIYGAAARGFIMPGDFFNLGISILMALLCTFLPNLMARSQMKKCKKRGLLGERTLRFTEQVLTMTYEKEGRSTDIPLEELTKVTEFDNAVRPAICVSFDVALGRWTPSSSDSSSGLLAMSNRPISTRSGPSTKYDELGTYWNDGGHTVTVLSRASGNDIWWLQVEFEYGGKTVRVYTGEQRIDIDVSRVPIEGGAIGSGRVTSTTTAYYGPGTNYKQHQQKISSGTTGAVMAWENGYVCLEFQPSGSYQIRRVWLPENVVSITYY